MEQNEGDFFGDHPKKVPLSELREGRTWPANSTPLNPLLPTLDPLARRARRLLELLCDAKYAQKILCRNFAAPRLLQQI
jgi:hypothetical protein